MFKSIKSFSVDHTNMVEGIYERDTLNGVKTWDLRFKKPNKGDYLSPEVMHTLEHFMATYFKNVLEGLVYYFGPMGCQTGFYLLTDDKISRETVVVALLGAHAYVNSSNEIPGATEKSCGQASLQDLKGARDVINEFYNNVLATDELTLYENLLSNRKEGMSND